MENIGKTKTGLAMPVMLPPAACQVHLFVLLVLLFCFCFITINRERFAGLNFHSFEGDHESFSVNILHKL